MSEYRTTATLTPEGTFVVPRRHLSLGAVGEAEVTARYDAAPPPTTAPDPIKDFHRWLEAQPPRPSAWEQEQSALRELRDEWD